MLFRSNQAMCEKILTKWQDEIRNQSSEGAEPDAVATHHLRQDLALFSMAADMTIRGIPAGIDESL